MAECVIHWFRRDLRLEDNTGLDAALNSGDPVLPVFILDDAILAQPIEPRRLRLLRTALEDLEQQLRRRGGLLLVRRGDAPRELNRVAEEADAWGVYLNRDHTPYARRRDARATRGLQMTGVVTQTFDDLMLVSPQVMVGADGLPPADFDDFSRAWLQKLDVAPEPPAAVERTFTSADAPHSTNDWADSLSPRAELPRADDPRAEDGATPASVRLSLEALLARLGSYRDQRAPDAVDGGSPLFAALRLGTISVRQVARAVLARAAADESCRQGAEALIRDLCRREHAYHLLHAHPEFLRAPGPGGEYVRHWVFGNRLT